MRAGFRSSTRPAAEALIAGAEPALVLLDTKLPDINGLEVCRRLKADPGTRAILVLQTSASYIAVADKIEAL
jgi:CheY-like chemotaxis protein